MGCSLCVQCPRAGWIVPQEFRSQSRCSLSWPPAPTRKVTTAQPVTNAKAPLPCYPHVGSFGLEQTDNKKCAIPRTKAVAQRFLAAPRLLVSHQLYDSCLLQLSQICHVGDPHVVQSVSRFATHPREDLHRQARHKSDRLLSR